MFTVVPALFGFFSRLFGVVRRAPTTLSSLSIDFCCYQQVNDIFIRLKTRLQLNIGNTFGRVSTMFTRSAITPAKVNLFEWNLEHSEYIVWGWLRQILGAIRAVAREGEPGEFFVTRVTHDFADFPSAKFHENWTQHVDRCRDESFRNRILKISLLGSSFQKTQNLRKKRLGTSCRRNSATVIDRRKFPTSTKLSIYGMSSFHFTVRINSKSFPWPV